MKFYTSQHQLYCGIDLHAKRMYLCIVDAEGNKRFHRNVKTQPAELLAALEPFKQQDLVVGVESTYNWYWLANVCEDNNVPFLLGHALAMKAIHGAKTKNDKLDSERIAMLMRGGNFPMAYVYPRAMRAQRDLVRRRCYFTRRRAELQTHIRNTCAQYNLPAPKGQLRYLVNQTGLAERFDDDAAAMTIDADIAMINSLGEQIKRIEKQLLTMAKLDDPGTFYRLKAMPGIGDVLALVMLYEIGNIARFAKVGNFLSYCRLVPGQHTSAGKNYGSPGRKQGNPHLKWAFSEAVSLLLRDSDAVKAAFKKLEKRHGRGKALSILAARLGRAVYLVIKRGDFFNEHQFLKLKDDSKAQLPASA